MWSTLNKFTGVEIHQGLGQERYVFMESPLSEVYRFTPAKINIRFLHLLYHNKTKITENALNVEDVLKKT